MDHENSLSPFVIRLLPWLAAIAFFMQTLDASILNTALPAIAKDLKESPLNMQSAVISYALTLALFIPVSGYLSDRFGTRNIFVSAVFLFTFGSMLCALSDSLLFLDISRVIQAIGGSMMVPVSRLVLIKSFKRSDFLAALNTSTIPGLVGPVVGPVVGGYLVEMASWHWIFLINLPIGLIGVIIGWRYMPNIKGERLKFDQIGFFCIVIALISATLSLEFLSQGEDSNLSIFLGILAIIFLLVYRWYAARAAEPLFPLSLFKIRTFRLGIIGNLFSRLGISGIPFLIPLFLQVAFGYSAIFAGFMLVPMAMGSLLMKTVVPKILRTWGYRRTLITNTIAAGIFIMSLSQISPTSSTILFALLLFCIGSVNSLQFTAMNSITLADLHGEQTSSGNSLMTVNQQLAISFGIAFGSVLIRLIGVHTSTIPAFQSAFIILGIETIISTLVFTALHKQDGKNLTTHEDKK
ncbi:DHA2 family efflux MFS transporter permease subunit [Orbaceae bacterium ESL0721]|nr:DHA2 family efflux MFS transporter permease subunit [Orbaceae bacterium ESL0721]